MSLGPPGAPKRGLSAAVHRVNDSEGLINALVRVVAEQDPATAIVRPRPHVMHYYEPLVSGACDRRYTPSEDLGGQHMTTEPYRPRAARSDPHLDIVLRQYTQICQNLRDLTRAAELADDEAVLARAFSPETEPSGDAPDHGDEDLTSVLTEEE